jgi:hypothetical protein
MNYIVTVISTDEVVYKGKSKIKAHKIASEWMRGGSSVRVESRPPKTRYTFNPVL